MTDMTSKAAGTGADLQPGVARPPSCARTPFQNGLAAITLALTVLVLLLVTLAAKSFTGQTHIAHI